MCLGQEEGRGENILYIVREIIEKYDLEIEWVLLYL